VTKVLAFTPVFHVLLFVSAAVAVAAAVVLVSRSSEAQEIVVRISDLNCDTDPETLTVANQGTTEVSMTGWNLQSDPTTTESLPLASFGVLAPGESLMVQAGPAASGPFVWSTQFLFRDGDPTDFARLASDDGLTVLARVTCPASQATTAATPAATAAPAQTAAPAAAPTVLPAGAVPVGGGPPSAVASSITPVAMMLFGSGLLSAGLATFAFPLLRRRPEFDAPDPDAPGATVGLTEWATHEPEPQETGGRWPSAVISPATPATQGMGRIPVVNKSPEIEDPLKMYVAIVLVILAVVALLAYTFQGRENKRE
jgi:hypothetical protein